MVSTSIFAFKADEKGFFLIIPHLIFKSFISYQADKSGELFKANGHKHL